MRHPLWLAVPCTLALFTACGSAPGAPASGGLSDDELQTEASGSVVEDLQSALALFGVASPQAQGSCRTLDPSSILDGNGRPLDSDGDGVPDKAVWDLSGCARDGLTVSGQRELSDPAPTSPVPITYLDTPINLSETYTRPDGSTRTLVRNGQSSGTIAGGSLTIVRAVTDTVTDSAHPERSATWHNGVTVQYQTADGSSLSFRQPLPAGTVSVNGPREWDIVKNGNSVSTYLTVTTTTPLAYDPSCDGSGNRIFGSAHARSGAFNVQVYSDPARTQLEKTVSVTFQDCLASTTVQ